MVVGVSQRLLSGSRNHHVHRLQGLAHGYLWGASLSTIEESNFLPRDDFDCPISLTIRVVEIPRPQTGRSLGIFILNQ